MVNEQLVKYLTKELSENCSSGIREDDVRQILEGYREEKKTREECNEEFENTSPSTNNELVTLQNELANQLDLPEFNEV